MRSESDFRRYVLWYKTQVLQGHKFTDSGFQTDQGLNEGQMTAVRLEAMTDVHRKENKRQLEQLTAKGFNDQEIRGVADDYNVMLESLRDLHLRLYLASFPMLENPSIGGQNHDA